MSTFSGTIGDGANDGYAHQGASSFNTAADYIIAGHQSTSNLFHPTLRFTGVTIPNAETILSARVDLRPYDVRTGTCGVTIRAFDADNAGMPADYTAWNAAAKTTAGVSWNIPDVVDTDTDISTPDIKTVIQEVIDRGGWSSGNALIVVMISTGTAANVLRQFQSYDYAGDTAISPRLYISYGTPAGIIKQVVLRAFNQFNN